MDKDRIAGSTREIRGSLEATIGLVPDDTEPLSDSKRRLGGTIRDALRKYRASPLFCGTQDLT